MLKKIIDNYFTKLVIQQLKEYAYIYFLDVKANIDKKHVSIYVKKEEFKDKYYQLILIFSKEDSIMMLINYKKVKEHFTELLKKYKRSK